MTSEEEKENRRAPQVTVLMPVFNGGKYLRDAVASILGQTFQDFEFLVVDDGSRDQTQKILRSFSDPRLRVLTNAQNEGIWQSVNKGLACARGVYIARMDADDIALPERLEKQAAYLDQHPGAGAVVSTHLPMNSTGNLIVRPWEAEENALSFQQMKETMVRVCCICNSTSMVRAGILKRYRFNESLKSGGDYEMWLHLCHDDIPIYKFPEPLLRFRWHKHSHTFLYKRRSKRRSEGLRIKVKAAFLLRRLKWRSFNRYSLSVAVQLCLNVLKWIRRGFEESFLAMKDALSPKGTPDGKKRSAEAGRA